MGVSSDLARRHDDDPGADQRGRTQRDRDRILYSQPFLRLAGVTQVVTPREGLIFHSRLTHSLKVGQLARRLAEYLGKQQPDLVAEAGGIDPEAAEAAGFAHDIGHPPFGHAAEEALRDLIAERLGRSARDVEGYEGNAQAFRIACSLGVHRLDYLGLNLTRRTLRAILKYPWLHDPGDPTRQKKFGVYSAEADDLEWVLNGQPAGVRSLEAQVMDLADDITYSVHDLQDFFRAGLINPAAIRDRIDEYVASWFEFLARDAAKNPTAHKQLVHRAATNVNIEFYKNIAVLALPEARYSGTLEAKATLDLAGSTMIGKLLRAARLESGASGVEVVLPEEHLAELKFLQRIVWTEVIDSPRLASQQEGQRRIVKELFDTFLTWIEEENFRRLPPAIAELAENALNQETRGEDAKRHLRLRFASDTVASLTDGEALSFYQRLTGGSLGSITDLMPSSFV